MRRLFSGFATGWAAIGLLLIRLVAGGALIWEPVVYANGAPFGIARVFHLSSALLGVFLAGGYRTELAGGIAAAIEIWLVALGQSDLLVHILLATFAAGLALLGPGAWSVDAWIAGWRRIEIRRRPR